MKVISLGKLVVNKVVKLLKERRTGKPERQRRKWTNGREGKVERERDEERKKEGKKKRKEKNKKETPM